jgi:hypothetical protein
MDDFFRKKFNGFLDRLLLVGVMFDAAVEMTLNWSRGGVDGRVGKEA